ncbi:MAG: cell division protein FtsZ [Chloroflexi bacterium]|nr:cell division protein FtsZ [Chloroflexota bacterium]
MADQTAARVDQELRPRPDNLIVFSRPEDVVARPSLFLAQLPLDSAPVKIRVVGVGGAGGNVIDGLAAERIPAVDTLALNTDRQALEAGRASHRLALGETLTRGLGAGGDPRVGRQAAEESVALLHERLRGADMVFIAAGMGGGTGTGAAPIVAQVARDLGALCVALVTRPFAFEGRRRAQIAEQGIAQLRLAADTLIIVPNDRLIQAAARTTSMREAFGMADAVLRLGVQGLADLLSQRGLINVDFADVRTIMEQAGPALLGIGVAQGHDRVVEAVRRAMACPLLEGRLEGARRLLLNITGGNDLGLLEVHRAAELVARAVDPDANIIFGATIDPGHGSDLVKATLVATGFSERPASRPGRAAWLPPGVTLSGPRAADPAAGPPDGPAGATFADPLDVPPFLNRFKRSQP